MTEQKEFKTYIGHFMGSQMKNSGVKKDGTPWTSHDILFHHGDMTKPIRFTWFAPQVDYMPNAIYRVLYVVDSFTVDGEARTAKKAVKVEPSTETNLGYQDIAIPQPQNTGVGMTGGGSTSIPDSFYREKLQAYIKTYKEVKQPSEWEKYHFIVTFLLYAKPEIKPTLQEIGKAYDTLVNPMTPVQPQPQPQIVVEDV